MHKAEEVSKKKKKNLPRQPVNHHKEHSLFPHVFMVMETPTCQITGRA